MVLSNSLESQEWKPRHRMWFCFFPFFLILHSTCSWGDNPIDFILAFFPPFFVAVKLDTHLIYCDPLCLGRSYYFPGDYSTKCWWRAAVQKYECVWTEYGTEIEVLTEMHGGSCYRSLGRYLSWKRLEFDIFREMLRVCFCSAIAL